MTQAQAQTQHIDREQVIEIIHSVIERVEAKEDVSREKLYNEVKTLLALIEETRVEISQTKLGDVSDKHIPTATDELGAVIAATEEATTVIMDSCERITNKLAKTDPDVQKDVSRDVTMILEACSFQDITGQRISKVTKNLKSIEEKVGALVRILEQRIPGIPFESELDLREGDDLLKNGPQMPEKAVTQEDIDKLLADLF